MDTEIIRLDLLARQMRVADGVSAWSAFATRLALDGSLSVKDLRVL